MEGERRRKARETQEQRGSVPAESEGQPGSQRSQSKGSARTATRGSCRGSVFDSSQNATWLSSQTPSPTPTRLGGVNAAEDATTGHAEAQGDSCGDHASLVGASGVAHDAGSQPEANEDSRVEQ